MRTIQSTTELIDAETARAIIETCRYPGQRPIREYHINELANEMRAGTFINGGQITLAHINGGWVLLDGQHRLRSIVQSNHTCEFTVTRHFGLTSSEVADLYGSLDHPVIRTPADDAVAHGLPQELGFTLEQFNAISGAAAYILNSFHKMSVHTRVSLAVRRSEAAKYAAPYRRYIGLVKDGPTGRLWSRVPSVAVGIVILLNVSGDRPDEFWSGLAKDDGLRTGDPRKALLSWLSYRSVTGTIRRNGVGQSATREAQARAIATAWNAFYDGRSLSLVKVIDERAPIIIRGTGYDGKDND